MPSNINEFVRRAARKVGSLLYKVLSEKIEPWWGQSGLLVVGQGTYSTVTQSVFGDRYVVTRSVKEGASLSRVMKRLHDTGLLGNDSEHCVISKRKMLSRRACGDLYELLHREDLIMSEEDIKLIFLGMTKEVKRLHDEDIVHRDIKLENYIYYAAEQEERINIAVRLIDYDFAVRLTDSERRGGEAAWLGSIETRAPELVQKAWMALTERAALKKADVWALGVTMYAMLFKRKILDELTGGLLTRASDWHEAWCGVEEFFKLERGEAIQSSIDRLLEKIKDEDVKRLLSSMLKVKQSERATIDEVLLQLRAMTHGRECVSLSACYFPDEWYQSSVIKEEFKEVPIYHHLIHLYEELRSLAFEKKEFIDSKLQVIQAALEALKQEKVEFERFSLRTKRTFEAVEQLLLAMQGETVSVEVEPRLADYDYYGCGEEDDNLLGSSVSSISSLGAQARSLSAPASMGR